MRGKKEKYEKEREREREKRNRPIDKSTEIHNVGSSVACVSFQMRLIRTVDDADAGRARKSAHQRYRQREIHYF